MEDAFTIEFPRTVSDRELEALQAEIKQVSEVEDAGSMGARGVDPQMIMLWVQVISGVLGVVSTGVPIIQKIIEMIRGKGIKGAKITLANGTTISVDDISAKDLESLFKAARQQ
jgi:hypothetical protein